MYAVSGSHMHFALGDTQGGDLVPPVPRPLLALDDISRTGRHPARLPFR